MNSVIEGRVSDELWDASIGKLNRNPKKYSADYKNKIIHIIDSTSRGYISPMEAYDAILADYIPEILLIRSSAYQHLIWKEKNMSCNHLHDCPSMFWSCRRSWKIRGIFPKKTQGGAQTRKLRDFAWKINSRRLEKRIRKRKMKIKQYLVTDRQRAVVRDICGHWSAVLGSKARIVSEVRSRSVYGTGVTKISLLANQAVHEGLRKYT